MRGVTEAADQRSTAMCECERRSGARDDRDGREDCQPEPTVDDRGTVAEETTTTILTAAPPNA
jgi:hypothetical protein